MLSKYTTIIPKVIHFFDNEKSKDYNKNYYRINNIAYNPTFDNLFWDETDLVQFFTRFR